MSDTTEARKRSLLDRKRSRIRLDGLARFLRSRYPEKTAINIAALTGEPVPSVKRWLACTGTPDGASLLNLFLVFGPELIHAMVQDAPAWLSDAVREEQTRTIIAEIETRRTRLAALRP